jgi:ribosomal protein L23
MLDVGSQVAIKITLMSAYLNQVNHVNILLNKGKNTRLFQAQHRRRPHRKK